MRINVCILNTYIVRPAVLMIAAWLCLNSSSFIVAGESIIVEGKVSTTRNISGNITAVNLITDEEEVINITLNQKGKKLGKEMDGKKVEIIADVSGQGNDVWLEVISFKEV